MLYKVHSTFTRFTRYLLFNAEVACPFLASVPCLLHLPRACARPWHPFFVLVPRARLLPSLGPLCPCQFLVLAVRSFPSPVLPALLFVCSALCFSPPASCLVRLLSVPCPLYPSTSSSCIPHVACTISQPDSHLISSMVLVLCPFPVRASLVCWWLDLFVVGECSIDQAGTDVLRVKTNKKARRTVTSLRISSICNVNRFSGG